MLPIMLPKSCCLTICLFQIIVAKDLNLLILHNNDMHAKFEQVSKTLGTCPSLNSTKCIGGFARMAHVIREAREKANKGTGPKVLFLNAGDTYTGTPWFVVHTWKIVADFLNLLMPDVMSFGNHEFDKHIAGVLPLIDNVKFPIVAANLNYNDEKEMLNRNIPKSVVLTIDGYKIGIIGYLTPETATISFSGNIQFLDEVESINKESEKLVKEGVNIIIPLGHSGIETDKRIAANCPHVDLVVGGHSHTFLYTGPSPDTQTPEGLYPTVITQKSGKKVPVVQAFAYTKYLGRLNCTFNEKGDLTEFKGQPLYMSNEIPQDKDVLDLLEKYRPGVKALEYEVVGRSRVFLEGAQACRERECNLGNLIADSMVAYKLYQYHGVNWTDTPIALLNGGGIRSNIDPYNIARRIGLLNAGGSVRNNINPSNLAGNITRADLLSAIPFDKGIVTLSINGSDLLSVLEAGVRSNGETSYGEFLQVSGLQVVYDRSKPTMNRVVSVKVRCGDCGIPHYEDLDKRKTYRVITTDFLANGGDGHHVLQTKSFRKVTEDLNDLEVLALYFKTYSPVFPEIQGRIQFVNTNDKETNLNKKYVKEANVKGSAVRLREQNTFVLVFMLVTAVVSSFKY